MSSKICFVIGAGGHGKVVISLLRSLGYRIPRVYDDNPARWGTELFGIEVTGPVESILDVGSVPAVLAIGDNLTRKQLAEQLDLEWRTAVHPTAFVDSTASLFPGTIVLPNSTVHADARIGRHVIINSAATIEHDCQLEDYVHVAPGCTLAGSVSLKQGVMMGVGSSTIVAARVGAWSTVGAGAVVVSDIPEDCVAIGVPARPQGSSKRVSVY